MIDYSESLKPFAGVNLDEVSVKFIDYLRKELESKSVDYLEPLIRLAGGYETLICRFQLGGVDERLPRPLIIRLIAEPSDPNQPLKESVVQNTLTDLGYPVPAVYFTCTDKTVLVLKKITEAGLDISLLKLEGWLEGFRTYVNLNFNWLNEREMYFNAYRKARPLDETNIAYYIAVRSVRSLIGGAQGHVLLGHPEIIQLLLASIYEITGVKIKIPPFREVKMRQH